MVSEHKYQLTMNAAQAKVLVDALDIYNRMGLGQMNAVSEIVCGMHGVLYGERGADRRDIDAMCQEIQQRLTGYPRNGSYGIGNPKVCNAAHVAYDLQCVLRQQVAKAENHGEYSVWHGDPLHYGKEPLAECVVIESKQP